MRALASIILLVCGVSAFLGALGYGAMIWPWRGFDGVSKALLAPKVGLIVGAIAIAIGMLLRKTEGRRGLPDTALSPKLQAQEEDIKRRANEGRL